MEGFPQPYTRDDDRIVSNHPMIIMAQENRRELLRHPLCLALLRYKWYKYGRKIYFFQLLFYLAFLAALTTYILSIPNPVDYKELYDCSEFFKQFNLSNDSTLIQMDYVVNRRARAVLIAFWIVRSVVFILSQEYTEYIKTFRSLLVLRVELPWAHLMDITVSCLSLYVSLDDEYVHEYEDGTQVTYYLRKCEVYQVGAILLTMAWLNLLPYMRQLPVVGQYIIIFHDVLMTFLSFILVFFIFVISFALGFYLLLDYQTPFAKPQDSLLKTLIMMSGEYNYEDIFFNSGPVPFKFTTYAVFVVFFLLLCIITLNLLVGLTVDDIKTFLDDADLKKLTMRLEFVLAMEKNYSRRRIVEKFRIQRTVMSRTKGNFLASDVISKKRIWEQIIARTINEMRKGDLEQIVQGQKMLAAKLDNLELALRNLPQYPQTETMGRSKNAFKSK